MTKLAALTLTAALGLAVSPASADGPDFRRSDRSRNLTVVRTVDVVDSGSARDRFLANRANRYAAQPYAVTRDVRVEPSYYDHDRRYYGHYDHYPRYHHPRPIVIHEPAIVYHPRVYIPAPSYHSSHYYGSRYYGGGFHYRTAPSFGASYRFSGGTAYDCYRPRRGSSLDVSLRF